MTEFPPGYGRPAMRKSLVSFETRRGMPGHVQVRALWRFDGIAHYGNATVDGKSVPMFRNESTTFPAPWVEMTEESFDAFRRVWGK